MSIDPPARRLITRLLVNSILAMGSVLTKFRLLLGVASIAGLALTVSGCDNANVSYGVGFHSSPYGWGNSFSVGISSHHYRGYPGYRYPRRGP